jgi:transposase
VPTPAPLPKKNQEQEGLGRSCGGFSSKIHGVCDALGNPLHFIITAGQCHDAPQALPLIESMRGENLLADKGYDSDEIRSFAEKNGMMPHIPPRRNRVKKAPYDKHLYKERHKIECLFGFLKHYRRLFARFDKLKRNFSAFLYFVAALQWLK